MGYNGRMRVVITGATSMIGVALAKKHINNGDTVFALVKRESNNISRIPSQAIIVEANLDELGTCTVTSDKCDTLYHLAWMGSAKSERDNADIQIKNIEYTLSAVRLAIRLGCERFIGAGSQAEYGIISGNICEESETKPLTEYGRNKLEAGKLSQILCADNGIKCIWSRIFSVYGVNDHSDTMISYAINNFMTGSIPHFNSGRQKWNFLYEEDAGEALFRLGTMSVESGIYNVASKHNQLLSEFVKAIADSFSNNVKYIFDNMDDSQLISLEADVSKLINAIGDYERISFEEGIKRIIEEREKG